MKLIDLLVQELPKRGGWPYSKSDVRAVQDKDNEVKFHYTGKLLKFERNKVGVWGSDSPNSWLENDINGVSFFADEMADDFSSAVVTREQYEAALAASQQPAWNGEGLPPVGIECEVDDGISWYKSVIVAHYKGMVFAWSEDDDQTRNSSEPKHFRPILTEPECRRKEISQQMCNLFGNGIEINEKEGYGTGWLDVYDAIAAGKIPGVKLED